MEDIPSLLKDVLAALQEGFALGAGTGRGQGRMVLKGLKATRRSIDAKTGNLVSADLGKPKAIEGVAARLRSGRKIKLRLTCEGPFFVNDASWDDIRKLKSEQERKELPQLRALGLRERDTVAVPVLDGRSLKGALRSVSAWLENGREDNTRRLFGSTERAPLFS